MSSKYFYHNSYCRDSIIKTQKVIRRKFDYNKYVSWVLENLVEADIKNNRIPINYPGVQSQAPLMGNGLYCFEHKDAAKHYANGKIVVINYETDYTVLDLDDKVTKLNIWTTLVQDGEKRISELDDHDAQVKWPLLFQLIKKAFINNFDTEYSNLVGVFLFFWVNILKKEPVDVVTKTFSGTLIKGEPYFLIKNLKKVQRYTR